MMSNATTAPKATCSLRRMGTATRATRRTRAPRAERSKPPLARMAGLLQLLLQLGQVGEVRSPLEDLPGRALDEPGLLQAQGVEADGVRRVVLPPDVVGDLLEVLDAVPVVVSEAAVDHDPGRPLRVLGHNVGPPVQRPQRPLGGHRVLL